MSHLLLSAQPAVANGWESSPRAGCEQLSDADDLVRKPCLVLSGSRHVIIDDVKTHKAAAPSSSSMSDYKCWILKPAITLVKYGGSRTLRTQTCASLQGKHVLKRLLVYTASGYGLASSTLPLSSEYLMKQTAATVTLDANICSFC